MHEEIQKADSVANPGFFLLLFPFMFVFVNWTVLIGNIFTKKNASLIAISPFLTPWGFLFYKEFRPFWWIGWLIDPAFYMWVIASPRLINEAWNTSRFTLARRFVADAPPRTIVLSLHHAGNFVLRMDFDQATTPADARGVRPLSLGMVGQWERFGENQIRLWGYGGNRECVLATIAGRFTCSESGDGFSEIYSSLQNVVFDEILNTEG